MGKKSTKKPKNELVFDNKKREEFLKGFSKRKKLRQRKAQDEMEQKLKDERKRIKDESKNLKEKYKQSFKPIEDLKDVVSDDDGFEIEDVTVTISQPKEELNKKFIGLRKCENSSSESEMGENDSNDDDNIKGMELEEKKMDESKKVDRKSTDNLIDIKSEKDFKKMIKKKTKSALKKSKVVQMKNKINHKKNVKLSNRKKHFKEKFLKKHKKISKHSAKK